MSSMMAPALACLLILSNPQVASDPFAAGTGTLLPYTGWAHVKTQVLAVADDGSYVLASDGMFLEGYRLDKRYSLIPNYPDRVIFPGGAPYKLSGRYYGLSDGMAMNLLASPSAETKYAVFAIDPMVDKSPVSIVKVGPRARLVFAEKSGFKLELTVAEYASESMEFVEYEFELSSPSTPGVRVAKRLKRKSALMPVRRHAPGIRLPIEVFDGGAGSVSADGSKMICDNAVVSLRDGTVTTYEPGAGARMFFVGNQLCASRDAPAAGATLENNYGAGIFRLDKKLWTRASQDILQVISSNGRYALLKRLPQTRGGETQWVVAQLRPSN